MADTLDASDRAGLIDRSPSDDRPTRRPERIGRLAVVVVALVALAVVAVVVWPRDRHENVVTGASPPPSSSTTAPSSEFSDFEGAIGSDGRLTGSFTLQSPGALQLDPLPPATSVRLNREQALAQAQAQNLTGSASVTPAVALASVTSLQWGTPHADGSFTPAVDHRPVWVIWSTGVELHPMGGAAAPPDAPTTADPGPMVGQAIVLVDAQTGEVLTLMESG